MRLKPNWVLRQEMVDKRMDCLHQNCPRIRSEHRGVNDTDRRSYKARGLLGATALPKSLKALLYQQLTKKIIRSCSTYPKRSPRKGKKFHLKSMQTLPTRLQAKMWRKPSNPSLRSKLIPPAPEATTCSHGRDSTLFAGTK